MNICIYVYIDIYIGTYTHIYIHIYIYSYIYGPWVQHVFALILRVCRYVAHDARMQAGRNGTGDVLLPAVAVCV